MGGGNTKTGIKCGGSAYNETIEKEYTVSIRRRTVYIVYGTDERKRNSEVSLGIVEELQYRRLP